MPRPFHIALAFPELGREALASFEAGLARAAAKPDLILFPEAFETIPRAGILLAGPQKPVPPALEELAARYQAFADRHDAAVHLGFQAS
ncbi:MAG: hypothetical protein PW734_08760 [Verrucomicrobium sp.]|nr:hypothetical protein [Verrucomicrobium sp.]